MDSPREATLALSDRGLLETLVEAPSLFFFSKGFAIAIAAAVLSLSLSLSSFHDRCHWVLVRCTVSLVMTMMVFGVEPQCLSYDAGLKACWYSHPDNQTNHF